MGVSPGRGILMPGADIAGSFLMYRMLSWFIADLLNRILSRQR